METIGLIAGNGTFPLLFARAARERGFAVAAVAHRGETCEGIEQEANSVVWVKVGQLSRTVEALKSAGVERAVMAGGIDKARSLWSLRPDWRALRVLRGARGRGDNAILLSVAAELEREGIRIVESTIFLDRLLAAGGRIAGPRPSSQALADIALGCMVLGALGPHDVGQAAVVEDGVVLAIEAIEGTDAALRRGGALGSGRAVLVKIAKPGQDMRFDVPAVGSDTIEAMAEAGAATLAVEAGRTIILDTERACRLADTHRISIVGCTADGQVRRG